MPEYIFCLPFYPTSGKKSRSCERFSCAVIVKIVVAQWGWPITHLLSGLFTKINFFPSIRLVDGRPSVIYRLARKSWWSCLILSIKRPPLSPRPRIKSLIIAARWMEVCFPSVSSWKSWQIRSDLRNSRVALLLDRPDSSCQQKKWIGIDLWTGGMKSRTRRRTQKMGSVNRVAGG